MRIQVPACPRPQGPGPTRVEGRQGPAPSRASRLFALLRLLRCRREQADGIPVAETGMPNFDSGYDLRPGYGSKVVTR